MILPTLYSQENNPDPLVFESYIHPQTAWQWFVLEGEGDELFGLVAGFEVELGYFSREELEANKCVKRSDWIPVRLSKVREWLRQQGVVA
jgi:hypothetical protein